MEIKQSATAGALESGDAEISISESDKPGLEISIQSTVKAQFGDSILDTVGEVLESFRISQAVVHVDDRAALDYVIRSRTQVACCRATGGRFNWKGGDC